MLCAPVGEVLQVLAVVEHRGDHIPHVVGQAGAFRQHGAQLGAAAVRRVEGFVVRGMLEVVGREEAQQLLHRVERLVLAVAHEGRHARLGCVAAGAAEVLEGDLLAGHRAHHVGAGDEHVRLLANHEDEVGDRRAVDGTARARPEDHRYLRHHARGAHVAREDAPVGVEAHDPLLDTRPGAVVQTDHRRPGGDGKVHDLVDLGGEHLAQGAPEDGEVLREDEHLAAVDRAPAGDDAVRVGPLAQAALSGPVAGQHVEFVEGPRVQQVVDALAGQELALGVLALHGPLGAGVPGLFLALCEFGEAFGHGMIGHRHRSVQEHPIPPAGGGRGTIVA